MYKTCYNCNNAHLTNAYYEDVNGHGLGNLDIFVAYCPNIDCYVLENDYCNQWKEIRSLI